MVTVERFLMVHEGRLYELHTDADSRNCELHYKNGGECQGCSSGGNFSTACGYMSTALKSEYYWHWRELK